MTLQQLKYAVTAAECGTISAAAEKQFISQPRLTTAIRELEAEKGVTPAPIVALWCRGRGRSFWATRGSFSPRRS